MKLLFVLAALCCCTLASSTHKDTRRKLNGYQVLAVEATNKVQLDLLRSWRDQVNFWTEPNALGTTDVMVAPDALHAFRNMMQSFGLKVTVKIEDVQRLIDEEFQQRMSHVRKNGKNVDWKHYNTYQEIITWLDEVGAEHLHVQSHLVGKTTEGRDLIVLRINTGEEDSKPKIWLDFGIHAREWVTPAVGTYIVDQLVNNSDNKDLLDKFEFYILAVHNPDGYAFTFESDRMWRKTRSYFSNPDECIGTDPNRNFGHHWAETGSSDWHCSETFHGPEAFSEPETREIADYITQQNTGSSKFIAFYTVHSYSQLFMTPWAYTSDHPDAYDDMMVAANAAVKAIKAVHGLDFIAGSVTDVIYSAAGASSDWAHGVENIKYAYGLELRDKGQHGFLLPPEQIIPASEETWAGIAASIRSIAQQEGIN